MNVGDTLIYGDGEQVLIEGFPTINGQPGVMVKPSTKPLFVNDVFRLRSEIDLRVAQGIWKIESKATEGEGT